SAPSLTTRLPAPGARRSRSRTLLRELRPIRLAPPPRLKMAASPLAMGKERRISNRPNKGTRDPYVGANAVTAAVDKTVSSLDQSPEHLAYILSKILRRYPLDLAKGAGMIMWLTREENSFTTTRQLALSVRRQAEVRAISDVFLALAVVFLGCVGLAALMRPAGAAGGGH